MMVETNTAPLGTAFTVPIDHRTNKTGITAQERAATVPAVIDPKSKPTRFRPAGAYVSAAGSRRGRAPSRRAHRSGHRSGAAGRTCIPPACSAKFSTTDGNRADRERLFELAREHNLQIITIEQLIRHRRMSEKLVYPQRPRRCCRRSTATGGSSPTA